MKTFWERLRQPWSSDDSLAGVTEELGTSSWHWILPEKLAVGPMPRSEALDQFKAQGIQAIFSLCDPSEADLPVVFCQTFHCVQFSLPDSHQRESLLTANLATAVDLLENTLQAQGATYVHCLAGVERSPTVCVAYLCRYHHWQLWEALNWVKSVHARTGITSEQLRVIADYLSACDNASAVE